MIDLADVCNFNFLVVDSLRLQVILLRRLALFHELVNSASVPNLSYAHARILAVFLGPMQQPYELGGSVDIRIVSGLLGFLLDLQLHLLFEHLLDLLDAADRLRLFPRLFLYLLFHAFVFLAGGSRYLVAAPAP